jgi:hypothetical protein
MILLGGTDGQDREAAPEKGVCRICDLDFGHILFQWVIEGGIKLVVRSTRWDTSGC